jgi:hypothetical protein
VADKLQAVHDALADVFSKSNLNATDTENSHAAFDLETVSEAFSEPHLNVINTEQSVARFDHVALAEMFGEAPIEKPSPASLGQAFAEMLSKRPPISTLTEPSQPGFDHQALAEVLTESLADPIDSQMSPITFDVEALSSSTPFSDQIDHQEPVAKAASSASAPANAEAARPPKARSLLAKLHHIFANKEELPLPIFEKDPLPQALSDQLNTAGSNVSTLVAGVSAQSADLLAVEQASPSFEKELTSPRLSSQRSTAMTSEGDVATSPAKCASTWSAQPMASQAGKSSPVSDGLESSPPIVEKNSPPAVVGRPENEKSRAQNRTVAPEEAENVDPPAKSMLAKFPVLEQNLSPVTLSVQQAENAVEVAAKNDPESARAQQATSGLAASEFPSSTNVEPSPPIFEIGPSGSILNDPLDSENEKNAEKHVAESARSQGSNPPLIDLPPSIPTIAEFPTRCDTEPSPPILSDQFILTTAPINAESPGARQAKSFSVELPLLISINEESSPVILQETSHPNLLAQPPNFEAAAELAEMAPPIDTETARPQNAQSHLTEPAHPNFQPELTPANPSGRSGNMVSEAEAVVTFRPTNTESAGPKRLGSWLAELAPMLSANPKSPRATSEKEPSHPTSTQLKDLDHRAKTVFVAPSANLEVITLSGELGKAAPVVESALPSPPTRAVSTERRTEPSSLPDPALVSTNTRSSKLEQSSRPVSPLDQRQNTRSVAAHPTEADDAQPQGVSSALTALRLQNAKPWPPVLNEAGPTLAGQPDTGGMPLGTIADPTKAEGVLSRQLKLSSTEMPDLISTEARSSLRIFEKERLRPPAPDQQANAAPTVTAAAVASLTDKESALTRAEQAKSLLAELDLNTAIHLRWVMRDIRSKRTKFSPVSRNDLAVLMDLGLVDMREELPRLTGLGVLALD